MKVWIMFLLPLVWAQCNMTECGQEVWTCNQICVCPDPPCHCCQACAECTVQVWMDCCACVGLCDSPVCIGPLN